MWLSDGPALYFLLHLPALMQVERNCRSFESIEVECIFGFVLLSSNRESHNLKCGYKMTGTGKSQCLSGGLNIIVVRGVLNPVDQ